LQIKFDELIGAMTDAQDDMIDLESLSATELERLRDKFAKLDATARKMDASRREAPQELRGSAPAQKTKR
jgi:low affinity Fe/Cu permease